MTPPDTIPIEGNARVEGKAGGLTMSWASFGPVTDAHFATSVPGIHAIGDEAAIVIDFQGMVDYATGQHKH